MNAKAHALIATVGVGGVLACVKPNAQAQRLPHPIVGGGLAAFFASLPDLIEPATSPNHRQFFHSIAFAAILGYGLYKVYEWQPEQPFEQILRALALVAGGAYLTHLIADSLTKRSIPFVGKLG
jgi:membrane-bound metal-dependent hydrolase YbcI (DUF457 family)